MMREMVRIRIVRRVRKTSAGPGTVRNGTNTVRSIVGQMT
jgi:hypothetical protein